MEHHLQTTTLGASNLATETWELHWIIHCDISNPTIEQARSLYDGVFHVLVQTRTTHENLKLTYKSPSGLGNLTTCGWVSGKRYTADMSSHITASLTCAQRLTLHVYCLLSSDFTHITLNFRSYLQHILICHQYVQHIERGVYFFIPDLGFE